jgi:hypothetical protein
MGDDFKQIEQIMSNNAQVAVEKKEGKNSAYRLVTYDDTFVDFYYESFADYAMPKVVLRFNGERFEFDINEMKRAYTQKSFELFLNHLLEALKDKRNYNVFLNKILELIYSGNIDFAWKVIDVVLKDHDLFQVDEDDFKLKLLERLSMSVYYKDLKQINANSSLFIR